MFMVARNKALVVAQTPTPVSSHGDVTMSRCQQLELERDHFQVGDKSLQVPRHHSHRPQDRMSAGSLLELVIQVDMRFISMTRR
jgi:hypothetical protein